MPNMLKIRIGEIIQKAPNKDDPAKLDQKSSGRPKAFRQANKQNYKYKFLRESGYKSSFNCINTNVYFLI